MISVLITLLISLSTLQADTTGSPPDTIDAGLLQRHTTYFTLADDGFNGADTLERQISEAVFITLGELHNSRNMARFTETLLRAARPYGFDRFAVETGPWSAEHLERLITEGPDVVSEFYNRYSGTLFGIYPVPFFTGKADLDMLRSADSLGYDLWGIDQEFAYSFRYLIDELARLEGDALTDRQDRLQSKLTSSLWWWERRSKIFSGFDLHCRLQNDERFQEYLDSFASPTEEQQMIREAMRASLEIYCLAESGEWSKSNQKRISYFKDHFDRYYAHTDSSAKVILKMGSYHAGRWKSPLGIYDVGHHLQELAVQRSGESLHLRFLLRWQDGEDKMGQPNWSNSTRFMKMARRDRWALIDARPLRKRIRAGTLTGADFEKREILNYDYIIMMPEDRRVERHY